MVRTSWMVLPGLVCAVLFVGASAQDDFLKVNVEREKQLIEGHVREFRDLLDAIKLQECRATIRLVEDRLANIKKEIPRADRQQFEERLAGLAKAMRQKEDSLVNVARDKLMSEGMDGAIEYAQQVLRRYGLPEERFQEIDKLLLEEAPKIQQKKEADAIARAVAALEAGRSVPEDIDPYLAMTARQMVQAKRDSVRAVQEQARADKARKEKPAKEKAARKKEPRVEEQPVGQSTQPISDAEVWPSSQKSEEQTAVERAAQRRVQDSIAAAIRAEQEVLDKQRRDRERQERAEEAQLSEKERTAREQQRQLAEEVERQRRAEERALEQQQREERERVQEAARRASAPQPERDTRSTPERAASGSDWTAQVDTARLREESERERQLRIETARREEGRVAAIEKLNRGDSPFHETEQASGQSASVREYMKTRKEDEKKAQMESVQIYELLEKDKAAEALSLFRAKRDHLAKYLTPEVFVVLERSVGVAAGKAAVSGTAGGEIAPRDLPKEEQYVMKIRASLNQRKWDQAVALFDGQKKALKAYMAKDEFEKLKSMVDSARQFVPKR